MVVRQCEGDPWRLGEVGWADEGKIGNINPPLTQPDYVTPREDIYLIVLDVTDISLEAIDHPSLSHAKGTRQTKTDQETDPQDVCTG
jgi:hypothetical protein